MSKTFFAAFFLMTVVKLPAQIWKSNADSVMNRVTKRMNADQTLCAEVTLSAFIGDTLETTMKGVFKWKKDRMNMIYRDSLGRITEQIIQVRDSVWIYDASYNRVTIVTIDDDSRIQSGGIFFVNPQEGYEKKIKSVNDTAVVVAFYPLAPHASYEEVDVTIDTRTWRETVMYTKMKNGSATEYWLKYTSANTGTTDDDFRFDEKNYPPGLQVFDNRKASGE